MADQLAELSDVEFELLLRGRVTKEENINLSRFYKGPTTQYTALLRFDYSEKIFQNIICYQDFSSKTPKANNEVRHSFHLPFGYLYFKHLYDRLKQKDINYLPSGVFRYLDQLTTHITVVLDMIFHPTDKYFYIVIENIDRCIKNTDLLFLASNSEVTLNLSSLPFNILNDQLFLTKSLPSDTNLSSVTSKQMANNKNNSQFFVK